MNLLITDFDGTFFDNNYEENIKAINKLKNINLIIATGRNYKSLKKDLKMKCKYYICNDGGYILDENENIIYQNYFNQKNIEIIYKRLKELNYQNYFFDYIDEFDTKIKQNVNKLSLKIRDNNALKDMNYLIKNLNNVYGYLSENWINILPIQSKKENAIKYILSTHNYNNVWVVGNESNDYGMINAYNGFLISNKPQKKYNCIKNFLELIEILNKKERDNH